jgi:lipopolysaccharide/colanic/teichoic acid biosynthesis glycosyltransferase
MRMRLRPHNGRQNQELNAKREGAPLWKRAFDLACVLVASPFCLLLGCAIAVGIKLHSKGPVLFKQERVGLDGQRFTCLKFRSMKHDVDPTPHQNHLRQLMREESPMTKLDVHGDTRLITLGKLLRATGLDELPQLINVWRGEMSLVGPRPCLPYEYEEYSDWAKGRLKALPGLTGYWQVHGKNHTSFKQMIEMDRWYAGHRSLWLDLKILARTPWVLIVQTLETTLAARKSERSVLPKAIQSTLKNV